MKTFTSLDGLDLFNLSTVFDVCNVGRGNIAIIKSLALTLSCPGSPLGVLLTLAIYISPNNGPIDLLLNEKNDSSCVGYPFCTLRCVSWTIIDEVTVPLSKGVVGLLVR